MATMSLILISIAIFMIAQFCADAKCRKGRFKTPRTERIAEAGASSLFIPRFDQIITENCILTIFGGDGYIHTSKNGKNWTRAMQRWTKRGCNINYILHSPNAECLDIFADEFGRCDKFHLIDCSSSINVETKVISEKYKTYHPSILKSPKGNVAWIENFHEQNSAYAFSIDFVSSEDFNKYPGIETILGDMDAIVSDNSARIDLKQIKSIKAA